MKKKFALLMLVFIVLPVFALFGCEDVSSCPVLVYSSSIVHGFVSGNGTYEDGQEITLTATAKNTSSNSSHFICWVYENSRIVSDEHVYKIENQLDSEQKPIKSTLTFTVSEATKGSYVAVFEEEKMMYAKLTKFLLTDNPSADHIENEELAIDLCTATINISQYQYASTPESAFSKTDFTVKNNVLYSTEEVVEVLKMTTQMQQHINVDLKMTFSNESLEPGDEQQNNTISRSFSVNLGYRTNIMESVPNAATPYSYVVGYQDGIYEINIMFNYDSKDFCLVLIYEDLAL